MKTVLQRKRSKYSVYQRNDKLFGIASIVMKN